MVDKKTVTLTSVCIILLVVSLATVVLLNQKNVELQLKTNQLFQIESDKNTLKSQVSNLESEVDTLNVENDVLESQVAGLQSEKAWLEKDNTNLNSQISTLNSEKTSLTNQNNALESQVAELQSEKASLETDKTNLNFQISTLQSKLATSNNEKASLQSQVLNLQLEVSTLENEVIESYNTGFDDGKAEGYLEGVIDGAGSGYSIRDPTYAEVMMFVASDLTDENEYIMGEYVCWNFVADFKANASQQGYRCAFVYIEFALSAHAVVCFNTTDQGIIYIEPQLDKVVTLKIGESYSRSNNLEWVIGDTIQVFEIIW